MILHFIYHNEREDMWIICTIVQILYIITFPTIIICSFYLILSDIYINYIVFICSVCLGSRPNGKSKFVSAEGFYYLHNDATKLEKLFFVNLLLGHDRPAQLAHQHHRRRRGSNPRCLRDWRGTQITCPRSFKL